MEKRSCKTCGRLFDAWFYEKECYACRRESEALERKTGILKGEITETEGEEEIVCPWCGEAFETDLEDDRTYTEGGYEYECPECEKMFFLETCVSITYNTMRTIPAWIEREKKMTELYRNHEKYSNEEFARMRNEILQMQ